MVNMSDFEYLPPKHFRDFNLVKIYKNRNIILKGLIMKNSLFLYFGDDRNSFSGFSLGFEHSNKLIATNCPLNPNVDFNLNELITKKLVKYFQCPIYLSYNLPYEEWDQIDEIIQIIKPDLADIILGNKEPN